MAGDKKTNANTPENIPIYVADPIDDSHDHSAPFKTEVVPEEVPEVTPEELTLSDLGGGGDASIPVIDDSTFGGRSEVKKYLFLGLGVVAAIVIFILVFLFIRSLFGPERKKVTLEYWGIWEDVAVMKPIIDEYTRLNPEIKINYVKHDPRDYREKLLTRGKEGRGPDIFRFHNTWLPSIIELAAPLPQSAMSSAEFKKTFYEVMQDDLFSENAYYGIPLGIDGLVLVYNTDLFKKVGIASPPQTWDDVLADADALRVEDVDKNLLTSGISLGTAENIEHFSDIFAWMLLQNGGDLTSLSNPEGVEVLKNYRQFAEPQLNFWNESLPNNITAFAQGKVAMIIVPSWQILEILAQNPDIKMKATVLPILPGTQQLSLATYWVEGVSKTSKNQEEAWKFLVYLSQKDTMTKLYQEQSKVRPFGVAYSRVDLRDTLLTHPYLGAVLEQAPHMKSLPLAMRTYDNGLNDDSITYIRDAINATIKGVSYQTALQTAAQGVQQVLQKYKIQ